MNVRVLSALGIGIVTGWVAASIPTFRLRGDWIGKTEFILRRHLKEIGANVNLYADIEVNTWGTIRLDIPGCREETMQGLSGMPLGSLNIAGSSVSDLTPNLGLVTLKRLNVSNTTINTADDIRRLTELYSLNISGTAIRDIAPLRYLALEQLFMDNTAVTNVSALAGQSHLRELSIVGTRVADFSPLARLPRLDYLALSRDAMPPGKCGWDVVASLTNGTRRVHVVLR